MEAQAFSCETRVSIVTPTQASAAAIRKSRAATRNANIALYLNAAEPYVRRLVWRHKGGGLILASEFRTGGYRVTDKPLTGLSGSLISSAMLQHNSAQQGGRRAHLAHAAVMGLHAVCCGLPALAMLAAALSGATSGAALLSDSVAEIHHFLHAHELWVLVLSAALVVTGGVLEARSRRIHHHGFPWLFAFSVFCFLANVTIIAAHRA